MRTGPAVAMALVLLAAGLGAGYEIGNSTSHNETTTSTATTTITTTTSPTWKVLVQNGTFTGPGCRSRPVQVFMALRIPCLDYTNSTTWYASLVLYNGKEFYATNETVASLNDSAISTTYTVWFDNSTQYCVSPYLSVSELPTCPPP